MGRGRHRKPKPQRNQRLTAMRLRDTVLLDGSVTGAPLDQVIAEGHAYFYDGDATEQVFNLMACVHPAQCNCETAYPNWAPGLR